MVSFNRFATLLSLLLSRPSKNCRHSDVCVHKTSNNLRKVGSFEHETGIPGHTLRFWHNLTKLFKVLHVLWHFKPIPLRNIVSWKIWPTQNTSIFEGLLLRSDVWSSRPGWLKVSLAPPSHRTPLVARQLPLSYLGRYYVQWLRKSMRKINFNLGLAFNNSV